MPRRQPDPTAGARAEDWPPWPEQWIVLRRIAGPMATCGSPSQLATRALPWAQWGRDSPRLADDH